MKKLALTLAFMSFFVLNTHSEKSVETSLTIDNFCNTELLAEEEYFECFVMGPTEYCESHWICASGWWLEVLLDLHEWAC